MGDEIEQYLLAKLSDGLKDSKLEQHPKFLSLQNDLKSKLNQSPTEEMSKRCREKLYQLNNLLAEYKTVSNLHTLHTPLHQVWFRQNLDRRLNKIKQELQAGPGTTSETSSTGHGHSSINRSNHTSTPPPNNINIVAEQQSSSSPPPNKVVQVFRWSTSSRSSSSELDHVEEKVRGFEDEKRSLVRLLLCPENTTSTFNAVGIVGMGGVGKTTLCQLVFNNPQVKNHFLPRIWVCMSKQPKEDSDYKKEIVKRMLRCLGVEEEIIESADENHGLGGLIFALHLQLRGKKYLIVLDDAWNINGDGCFGKLDSDDELTRRDHEKYWGEKLSYGLPKGCGGTVIVTSRSEEVAKSMVGENLRRLLPISDKEICWQIFTDSVEKDNGTKFPPGLEHLKPEILNKCDGLPLAAKMMGQIMQQQLQNKLNSNQTSPPNLLNQPVTNNLPV